MAALSLGAADCKLKTGQNVAYRRGNEIFRIMSERVMRKSVRRGQGGFALNAANAISRRSALFQHCKEHLITAMALGHNDGFARQREANARLMLRYAQAVETRGELVAPPTPGEHVDEMLADRGVDAAAKQKGRGAGPTNRIFLASVMQSR